MDRARGAREGPLERLSPERVAALLEVARGVRVLVVGDLMLDRYLIGSAERVSPEAPVPVVRVEREREAVGGAANVAANVAALGAACDCVGLLGADRAGERVLDELRGLSVGVDGIVRDTERPTTVKTRVLARHQQVVRFDHEVDEPVTGGAATALADAVRRLAPSCDAVVLQDYDKGALPGPVIGAALDAAAAAGIPVVADPKERAFFTYEGVTVLKPNARELARALGEPIRPDDQHWMRDALRRSGAQNLLVTLGARGLALQPAEGALARVPTVARDVYDVSGAGDTVTAVLAVALGSGADLLEAALLANHAAAIQVGRAGVTTVSPIELTEQARHFHEELAG